MEINKNELKILELFRKELFLKESIKGLMKRIKSNSYQRVHEAVEMLVKKNVIFSEKIGNTNLISLKFSREAILLLSFLDEKEAKEFPKKIKKICLDNKSSIRLIRKVKCGQFSPAISRYCFDLKVK